MSGVNTLCAHPSHHLLYTLLRGVPCRLYANDTRENGEGGNDVSGGM